MNVLSLLLLTIIPFPSSYHPVYDVERIEEAVRYHHETGEICTYQLILSSLTDKTKYGWYPQQYMQLNHPPYSWNWGYIINHEKINGDHIITVYNCHDDETVTLKTKLYVKTYSFEDTELQAREAYKEAIKTPVMPITDGAIKRWESRYPVGGNDED